MENNNYFTEMMRSPMPREKERNATDVYIDKLLNDILFKQEKQRIMVAIDQTLDKGDREAFMKLSHKLNELERNLNS